MTYVEAAIEILQEHERPMEPTEIARIAFDQELVTSSAKDPVSSMAGTLRKAVRYGQPSGEHELTFNEEDGNRKIALRHWDERL